MNIRIVVTGRSYHKAANLPEELTLAQEATVDDALAEINARLNNEGGLPSSCLIVVDGRHIGSLASHADESLRENSELTLIAPVAGG